MADVEPLRKHLVFPLFDPRSLVAQRIPLTVNANRLPVDEMGSFATMANQIREQILLKSLSLETRPNNQAAEMNPREERIVKKIHRSCLSANHTSLAIKDLANREKPYPCRRYSKRHRSELSISERIAVVHAVLV